MEKYNYKLLIAYDGTHYSGWQIQPNAISIQSKILKAIRTLLKYDVALIGSGRTDQGVHALGQVANFTCNDEIDIRRFLASLNGLLPKDIRIKSMEGVPLDFHSQYSALSKTYHYFLNPETIINPFRRLYAWHLHEKIDIPLMRLAAAEFLGTHDFTSVANEAGCGSASRDPIRTVKRLDIIAEPTELRLEFEADGFLYKMVRNIVGTLVEVASGKKRVSDIQRIILAKDRRQAGRAAPPHGLFLIDVNYSIPFSGIASKEGK